MQIKIADIEQALHVLLLWAVDPPAGDLAAEQLCADPVAATAGLHVAYNNYSQKAHEQGSTLTELVERDLAEVQAWHDGVKQRNA